VPSAPEESIQNYFFANVFFLPLPDIADFFGPFLVRALVFVR
jgi:hypothetical protein